MSDPNRTLESSTPTGQAEIDALGPWFHNLHLPDGRETAPQHPLGDFPRFKWKQIAPHLPSDLAGWTGLDIGCNAGFYTFQLAERGAEMLGVDVDEHYLRQARWAAKAFAQWHERVRFERRAVYDLIRMRERFDLVWFMGVFYHLRYPLLGLDIAASRARKLLIFQSLSVPPPQMSGPTMVAGAHASLDHLHSVPWQERAVSAEAEAGAPGQPRRNDAAVLDAGRASQPYDLPFKKRHRLSEPEWPKLSFIEHRFAGDPTNWWVPNAAAMESLLRSAGLEVIARPDQEIFICRPSASRDAHGQASDERQRIVKELQDATGTRLTID